MYYKVETRWRHVIDLLTSCQVGASDPGRSGAVLHPVSLSPLRHRQLLMKSQSHVLWSCESDNRPSTPFTDVANHLLLVRKRLPLEPFRVSNVFSGQGAGTGPER